MPKGRGIRARNLMTTQQTFNTGLGLVGNRYQVIQQLGKGGMGAVFFAKDRLTSTNVALKQVEMPDAPHHVATMSATMQFRMALAQEFKVLASLRHPHIISVLDYGFDKVTEKLPFFTMELLDEPETFAKYATGRTVEEKTDLLIQMLQALHYLHRRGIIHRDLKPDNVQVVHGQVKVLDFGLAIAREAIDPNDDNTAGTLAYMAPEVLTGAPPSEASDLYAVGVMAFEIFAGRYPFTNKSMGQMLQEIMMVTPDVWSLPLDGDVIEMIEKLLRKDPAERYKDVQQVMADLARALGREIKESTVIRESFLQAARFVGREEQLLQLIGGLQRIVKTDAPVGSAYLIGGESGVGKSRLLDELRTQALVEGVMVLRGQAVEGGGLPYQLWRDVLRRMVLSVPLDEQQAGILKEIVPDIDQLLDRHVTPAPELSGASGRERLSLAIIELFMAQKQPTLLILEDLQWSEESLDPLKELIRHAVELPLVIVGNYRNDERPDLPKELAPMQVITLTRLDDKGIEALSTSMLGEVGKRPDILELLKKETEGNIFFLVEVVRALAEEAGQLADIGQGDLPRQVFAKGIQEIVRRRLNRVPESMQDFLKLAAVAGRQLDLKIMRQAVSASRGTTISESDLEEMLVACADAAVLDIQDGAWRFAHDKLRERLIQDLNADDRRVTHRQVAEAIEVIYPNDDAFSIVLVDHWHEAGDIRKEATYAVKATRKLNDISNWTEGRFLSNRALEQLPPDDQSIEKIELLGLVGLMHMHFSEYPQAAEYFQQSLTLTQQVAYKAGEAAAHGYLGQISGYKGDYDDAQRHLERALVMRKELNNPSELALGYINIGTINLMQQKFDLGKTYLEDSLALYRQINIEQGTARALHLLAVIATSQGDLDTARTYYEESLATRRRLGDRQSVASTLNNLGWIAELEANYDRARFYYEECLTTFRQIGNRHSIANTLTNLGFVYLTLGQLQKANETLREALAISNALEAKVLVLEILVGFARANYLLGDAGYAAQLIGTVQVQSGVNHDVELRINTLRPELEDALDVEPVARFVEEGKLLDMNAVIEMLLTVADED